MRNLPGTRWTFSVCMMALWMCVATASAQFDGVNGRSPMCGMEPNAEMAATWWPPLRNVWTPIGWKSHPFRFAVLYNGIVIADPHPLPMILDKPIKRYLAPYEGLGVQISITPSVDGNLPDRPTHPYILSSQPDGGVGIQKWADYPTPVLCTKYPANFYYGNHGIVLQQEIFAHMKGDGNVLTGKEPLYAWIRLSVSHVDELSAPDYFHLLVHIGAANQIGRSMFHEDNLTVYPEKANYPRELRAELFQAGSLSGYYLVEANETVRLVAQTETGALDFMERLPGDRDYFLKVTLPAQVGRNADILLPMICGERKIVEEERALGYEGALERSDAFWAITPKTAGRIDTPEPWVNAAIIEQIRFAQVISEINPETGERSMLTGSWNYDTLWPTPVSMTAHMLMDIMGYHGFVAENLKIFKNHQGIAKAPGESYPQHPGYFGPPRELSSVDWLADHGAILHAICTHALLSGDRTFADEWLDSILLACDFIKNSRAIEDHGGIIGVLPPAVATDAEVPGQAVWNIAWNYKGLTSAVRLLQRMAHPRSQEFAEEARQYKAFFVDAYREHVTTMPRWTDVNGERHPVIPSMLSGPEHLNHPFFLDTGPLVLVYSRLLEAKDPLIQTALRFYREGPNTFLYDPRGNMHQRAILIREISSCEPCYSFNILCSWESGDRNHFLEGMYSLLTGALSSQTYVGCEHRHGIYGLMAPGALMVYLMRLAVIDDALEANTLHLLRLAPLAWIRNDYETSFENMPTEYGPVSVRFRLSEDGTVLLVDWEPEFRIEPDAVTLHIPSIPELRKVNINGTASYAKSGDMIRIQ